MRLEDIAMIAGDTTRSRAYLQALVRNELLPGRVILLDDGSADLLPGQIGSSEGWHPDSADLDPAPCWSEANFDPGLPMQSILQASGIPYQSALSRDINSSAVADLIRECEQSVFIYSGFGGVLLKRDVLSLGKRFLHVHGGYLPDFKGSTTNYFSLVAENSLGASAIFLSEKIDSGPILHRKKFTPPRNRQAIDHIYDSAARASVLVETLQRFLHCGEWTYEQEDNSGGETYYIVHPLIKHIAILSA